MFFVLLIFTRALKKCVASVQKQKDIVKNESKTLFHIFIRARLEKAEKLVR